LKIKTSKPECIWKSNTILGEGTLWVKSHNSIYFVDIKRKKIFILIFTLISFNCFAVEKSTTFSKEIFNKAQLEGKTVVVNSWNKFCFTCKKQTKILDQAENKFKDVLFLSFEQQKDKEIGIKIIFPSDAIISN